VLLSRLTRRSLRWVRGNSHLTIGEKPAPFLDANVTCKKPIFPPFLGSAADPNASYATLAKRPDCRVWSALLLRPLGSSLHYLQVLYDIANTSLHLSWAHSRSLCIAVIIAARSADSGSRQTGSAQRLLTCVGLHRGQDNRLLSVCDRDGTLACDGRRIARNCHCAH
jgi:hypothetical protein